MVNPGEAMRVVSSKPVQRAAINTAFLVSGAIPLFCIAAIVTGLFFRNYVPDQVVQEPVHLQYGGNSHPYGLVNFLSPQMIKRQQAYEISVVLSMPRSPANVERGNFMINLCLLTPGAIKRDESRTHTFEDTCKKFDGETLMARSRRSVLLPYVDPLASVAKRLVLLLYHMLASSSQTCKMKVVLIEKFMVGQASPLPGSAYVEIEAGQNIQIYSAALALTARLSGLRWLMVYYRLPTYLALTVVFWVFEVIFMGIAWAIWTATTSTKEAGASTEPEKYRKNAQRIKDEPYEQHHFPTYGRQPPLKYEADVKVEDDETRGKLLAEVPVAGAEADDEDELYDDDGNDGKYAHDSGLGTSYSERGSESVRRRPSRSGLGGGSSRI